MGQPRRMAICGLLKHVLDSCLKEYIHKAVGIVDICSLPLPTDDAGEAIKDSGFSSRMDRADGIVIVAPEYNHDSPSR